jgi:hypothetical protein
MLLYNREIKRIPENGVEEMSNMPPKISGNTDEIFTPKYAINPLLPYLNHNWKILECAIGKGHLALALTENGFNVIGSSTYNFLVDPILDCDCIVTNPPYSKKTKFLKKCFESGKPFALLLPLTALEGKERNVLYRNNEIEIIIPDRRVDFIMPESVKKSSSWFQVAWFTHGLKLPKQLLFVELVGK